MKCNKCGNETEGKLQYINAKASVFKSLDLCASCWLIVFKEAQ